MLRDPSLIPLSHQHQHGLALCVLTDRWLAQDRSAENVARLAKKIADAFEVELSNHFEIEERILFPACELPLVADLVAQHRQLEALAAEIREKASPEAIGRFTALLREHIRVEERDLFEGIQKALPREKLDELGRRIEEKIVRVCL
jgi:hemerythrin-like domain-containing protein